MGSKSIIHNNNHLKLWHFLRSLNRSIHKFRRRNKCTIRDIVAHKVGAEFPIPDFCMPSMKYGIEVKTGTESYFCYFSIVDEFTSEIPEVISILKSKYVKT